MWTLDRWLAGILKVSQYDKNAFDACKHRFRYQSTKETNILENLGGTEKIRPNIASCDQRPECLSSAIARHG